MDKYYGQEENVETPETQLDNFRGQVGVTATIEVWANETLSGLYDQTSVMWNKTAEMREAAEARGDQQAVEHLVLVQNNLTELYTGAQHMQEALLHSNAGTKSILEAAQALAKQKQAVEQELDKLTTAVEQADFSDPRIEQMAEIIETDLYEMISNNDEFYDPAEDVYDNAISQMAGVIRRSAPQTTYAIVERLFNTLLGDYEMNDIQRGLLLSLVNTIALDEQPHDND